MTKKLTALFLASLLLFATIPVSARSTYSTIYAPDGRRATIKTDELAAYLAVGWSDVPFVTIYAPDGRTAVIRQDEVAAYQAVGWFANRSDVYATIYAPNGNTAEVLKADVPAYVAYGWSEVPFVTIYAPDGRTASVPQSEVAAYVAVGWMRNAPRNKDVFDAFAQTIIKNSNHYDGAYHVIVNKISHPETFQNENALAYSYDPKKEEIALILITHLSDETIGFSQICINRNTDTYDYTFLLTNDDDTDVFIETTLSSETSYTVKAEKCIFGGKTYLHNPPSPKGKDILVSMMNDSLYFCVFGMDVFVPNEGHSVTEFGFDLDELKRMYYSNL